MVLGHLLPASPARAGEPGWEEAKEGCVRCRGNPGGQFRYEGGIRGTV